MTTPPEHPTDEPAPGARGPGAGAADPEAVGEAGFEPAASCSQSRRANQAALLPVPPCCHAGVPPGGLVARLGADATAGVLLVVAALAGVTWASAAPGSYAGVWVAGTVRRLGVLAVPGGPLGWVNDGGMALFLLVVGLELSRELRYGDLRSPRAAAVPVAAALGGMAGAGLAYVAVAHGGPPLAGYGVPMATDAAFAVGTLSLFGRRIPLGLRMFVLALAVADDLGSLAVLVLGYSERLDPARVAVAGAALLVGVAARRFCVAHPALVAALGIVCWLALEGSGVEPALAGVLAGALVASSPDGSPTRLETALRPVVNGAVLPAFALANAGVAIGTVSLGHGAGTVLGAILAARVVGKAAGITLAAVAAARLLGQRLPGGVGLRTLTGVAALCGVGFTVPLLVANRAFGGHPGLLAATRLGLLGGSLVALAAGAGLLLVGRRRAGSSERRAGGQ